MIAPTKYTDLLHLFAIRLVETRCFPGLVGLDATKARGDERHLRSGGLSPCREHRDREFEKLWLKIVPE